MNVIEELIGFVSSKFKVAGLIVDLVKLEAKLASLCIVPLIVTSVLLAVFSIVGWVSLMGLLGYAIFWSMENIWFALGTIFLLHIVIIGILLRYFLLNLNKVRFEKTRAFLARGNKDYEQKTKSRISHSFSRKKIMARTGAGK